TTTAKVATDGETLYYRARTRDCRSCPLKSQCCPKAPLRRIPRSIYEEARDVARINDQSPIKQVINPSMNGRAAFARVAIALIQSLQDNGKLLIKATPSNDGKVKEGNFNLGAVSEVRNKIAKACDWADGSVDEPAGSIDQQEKR